MESRDGERWKSGFSMGAEAGVMSPQVYAGSIGRGAESPKVYTPGTERRVGRASSQQTVNCNLASGVKTYRKGVYIPVLWWLLRVVHTLQQRVSKKTYRRCWGMKFKMALRTICLASRRWILTET